MEEAQRRVDWLVELFEGSYAVGIELRERYPALMTENPYLVKTTLALVAACVDLRHATQKMEAAQAAVERYAEEFDHAYAEERTRFVRCSRNTYLYFTTLNLIAACVDLEFMRAVDAGDAEANSIYLREKCCLLDLQRLRAARAPTAETEAWTEMQKATAARRAWRRDQT